MGVPPRRDDGVPKLRGELKSISEVGRYVGGEERSPGLKTLPGDWPRLLELGGGCEGSGEVTSDVCKVSMPLRGAAK